MELTDTKNQAIITTLYSGARRVPAVVTEAKNRDGEWEFVQGDIADWFETDAVPNQALLDDFHRAWAAE